MVEGLDIMFVRELCGGVYFGKPKGIDTLEDGSKIGYDNAISVSYTHLDVYKRQDFGRAAWFINCNQTLTKRAKIAKESMF